MKKLFLLLALVVATMTSCTLVDSGEVGIKFKKFSLTEQGTLDAMPITGFVFYNVFSESVFTYPIFVQRVDYDVFHVNTKDAAVFHMDPIMAYRLDRNKAIDIFSKYRVQLSEIQNGYMKTAIYDAYRITANRYTADELMANLARFESEVRIMLDSTLTKEGFIVAEFTSQIIPPESLRKMIDAKNAAVQSALKAENEVKEAEANAKIAIAEAEGDAKAMKIKADAEAYYNRTISASLTRNIIMEDWIEKWDGELPNVQGGNDMMPIVNLQ